MQYSRDLAENEGEVNLSQIWITREPRFARLPCRRRGGRRPELERRRPEERATTVGIRGGGRRPGGRRAAGHAFWLAALAACAVLWAFWDAYRDSGERLVDRLSSAPGMATRRQVAAACGVREVMRTMVPSVLPAMLAAAMRERRMGGDPVWPRPWQAAMYVGECHHVGVWLSLEMHAYVLGPTRSGKTVTVVIPAVVEAPGFVLATSTRSDIISATRRLRERVWRIRRTGPGTAAVAVSISSTRRVWARRIR